MSDDDDDFDAENASGVAPPAPRENATLVGHEAAEAALLASYHSGRLPHAWLFTGPRGVGKATLAFRFARFLFAQGAGAGLFAAGSDGLTMAPDHPVFRRVASGGHGDLLVVERGVDPRTRRQRTAIVVDDARAVSNFMHMTSAEGGWRIVIVDGADTMNRNAANAVLKILEEPPRRALLMLLSDNPGRLIPTIRSRCRHLLLKPLADAQVTAALQHYRPDLKPDDAGALARLGAGSIGRALELASANGLDLYSNIFNLLGQVPKINGDMLSGFADRLARRGAEASFALFAELLPGWLARMVILASGGREARTVLPGEAAAMRRLVAARALDQWVAVWENLTHLLAQADDLNLDRKQVVMSAFFAIEAAGRQAAGENP
jgi:DNA polymerase III subunit delta'